MIADGATAVLRCHSTGSLVLRDADTRVSAIAREVFVAVQAADGWQLRLYMNNLPTQLMLGARP